MDCRYPLDNPMLDDAWDDVDSGTDVRGARVLVVDDDDALRELVAMRLMADGHDVVAAVSGPDLLRVLEVVSIDRWPLAGVDLIVLDHRMPGMTGLEAIRRLRLARWETPAILITAFPDAAVKREAAMLGVPVIPKPFSLDLLANAVVLSLLWRPETAESHGFRVSS